MKLCCAPAGAPPSLGCALPPPLGCALPPPLGCALPPPLLSFLDPLTGSPSLPCEAARCSISVTCCRPAPSLTWRDERPQQRQG